MENRRYIRAIIQDEAEYKDNEFGTTVILAEAFNTKRVDFNNRENVQSMVAYAIQTANELYNIIEDGCEMSNVLASSNQRIDLFLALSALACEVYMKAIIYYNGNNEGTIVRGHELNDLFDLLDKTTQSQLEEKTGINRNILEDIGKTFTELRYVFELNYVEKDYLILFDLMKELKVLCDDLPVSTKSLLRVGPGIVRVD